MAAMFLLLTLYMSTVMEYSPLSVGIAYLPSCAVLVAALAASAPLVTRHGHRPAAACIAFALAAAILLLSRVAAHDADALDLSRRMPAVHPNAVRGDDARLQDRHANAAWSNRARTRTAARVGQVGAYAREAQVSMAAYAPAWRRRLVGRAAVFLASSSPRSTVEVACLRHRPVEFVLGPAAEAVQQLPDDTGIGHGPPPLLGGAPGLPPPTGGTPCRPRRPAPPIRSPRHPRAPSRPRTPPAPSSWRPSDSRAG
jgi:hypothetical protein